MESVFNLGSLTVDPTTGRASFSGLGTGIDIQGAITAILQAKRLPAVTLETRITANQEKIVALQALRTALNAVKSSLNRLRGAVSVGNTNNVFHAKTVFASTSRLDGLSPSAAGNLVGLTVSNAAAKGVHEIEIRRVATAHKIASSSFASASTALGLSGSFQIGSGSTAATITVSATDTLLDIRDRINNANTGTNATGVSASMVTVSSTQNMLVVSSDATGETLQITDSGSVLSGLGLSATGGAGGYRNGLASSKIESTDGFDAVLFDGTEADNAFRLSYVAATRTLTLTRGDGTSESVTLSADTIAAGETEEASFDDFGVTVMLNSSFNKAADITVSADTVSITGGTGAIDAGTVTIADSAGNISGITSSTLTFGNLATPAAISVSVGSFTGTFNGTSTGTKTVTLTNGSNSLTVQFNVTTVFDGTETAGSITLNELENALGATGDPFASVLQRPQSARITADGLTDGTHHESLVVADSSAQLGTYLSDLTFPGSFTINGTSSRTINFASTDTLETLRDAINVETVNTGVTATIVEDGGGYRLDFDSASAFTLTDTTGLLGELGVNNALVIERSSNTVTDLFAGVTLSLFAAEPRTTIKLEIEQDLSGVKTEITGFATAYNSARSIINQHQLTDFTTGVKSEDADVLFGNRVLADAQRRLANAVSEDVSGVDAAFAVLRQIGIELVDNTLITDPLLKDTLEIDETALDQVLLSNLADVRRLFAFEFTSSDPRVVLSRFTANTQYSASGYVLNIGTFGQRNKDSASVASASAMLNDAVNSFGATTSGSFTVNGASVAYNVATDTLDTLISNMNAAFVTAGNDVTARKRTDEDGNFFIDLQSNTQTALTIGGDTGDLVALLNFQPDLDMLDSANIGGAANGSDDGSATVSGRAITATDQTSADGLGVIYTGTGSASAIQIDFTVGVAADLFDALEQFVDTIDGSIQGEIAALEAQNEVSQDRVEQIDFRLDLLQASLLARFVAMETALTRMKQLLEGLKVQFEALSNANK